MKQKQTKRDPNAIYDRHGNRIRIWVGNDEEEKELSRQEYEELYKKSLKKNISKIILQHPNVVIDILRPNKGVEVRKTILKNLFYFKKKPEFISVKFSKVIFLLEINTFIGEIFNQIFLNDEYNIYESNIKNKIVIDAGANVGVFSLYASMLGAKKVYAFEPVKETYDMLVKNIKINKLENKVIPINKALGDKNETKTISFTNAGDASASLKEERKGGKCEEVISIIKLDDFVKENKLKRVDFIKMDVEGYEENVLLGAKETIKKWKPILSFSAYHLPTDKERLPKVVRSIRPDYKIKLNRYAEEDFYCE